ncbi:MAG TPA: hypothetical protein VH025_05635 [Solirubrobacteraceae bacterium]|jgi:hypothetical protein|nr:hypothetical protein [Solirubrobacteraceae bacterium]
MSNEQTNQPGTIVGGPVEASPVDGHMTFAYRIKREQATRDVSVYVPATCLEGRPGFARRADATDHRLARPSRARGGVGARRLAGVAVDRRGRFLP